MDDWSRYAGLPAIRNERHFGDRVIPCFAKRPASVHAMLADTVLRNPEGEALVCGDRRLRWREVENLVGCYAAGLAALGVAAGDRVALLLNNNIDYAVLVFAIARLGAVSVPLNGRESPPEIRHKLEDCGAVLILHEPELAHTVPSGAAAPALRHAIPAERNGGEPFAALLRHGSQPDAVPVDEDEAATILYTSGTTGQPKGAILTHLNIVHSALHYQVAMAMTAQDRSVVAVPMSHVSGLVALLHVVVLAGGTLIVMPSFRAADFLQLAAHERMTHTLIVPAMFNLCLLRPEFETVDLSAWRVAAYGGAIMPEATIARLARRLPGLGLYNCYGATETTSPAAIMPPVHALIRSAEVGLPVPCGDIRIMDAEGREVGPNEPGEIWIAGAMVVPGYWANPAATAREFTGGYWRSGDLGSKDAAGFLRVIDRLKDVINRAGYKIYAAEVENVLLAYPGVIEAAVVGVPCPVLGERAHAWIVTSGEVEPAELSRHCAAQLADYKIPESFRQIEGALPRNANGKVLKRLLRERSIAPG